MAGVMFKGSLTDADCMSHLSPKERLVRLERLLAFVFVLAVIPWLLLGVVVYNLGDRVELPLTLVSRGFEVHASDGNLLARLGDRRGHGSLELRGSDGTEFVDLAHTENLGGSLMLRNDQGSEVVYLGGDELGAGNLTLRTNTGDRHAILGTGFDGGGRVSLFSEGDQVIASMGENSYGAGFVTTYNQDQETLCQFGSDSDQIGCLRVSGPDGKLIAWGSDGKGDGPTLGLVDAKGIWKVSLQAGEQSGNLNLRDRNEKVRVFAGLKSNGFARIDTFSDEGDFSTTMGEAFNGLGGLIQTESRNGGAIFWAGPDSRQGSGGIVLMHPDGTRILSAGHLQDEGGGMIKLRDFNGTTTFHAPLISSF